MKLKDRIRITSYSSLTASIVTMLLIIGGFFDVIDIACASVASIIIHIALNVSGPKIAFMIYAVSSLLSLIIMPMRTCPILFVAFFGYYPIIRAALHKRIRHKVLSYLILFIIYNAIMIFLFTYLKEIFGVANEPMFMYVLLLVTANVFYISFDLLTSRIMILYNFKIKKLLKTPRK